MTGALVRAQSGSNIIWKITISPVIWKKMTVWMMSKLTKVMIYGFVPGSDVHLMQSQRAVHPVNLNLYRAIYASKMGRSLCIHHHRIVVISSRPLSWLNQKHHIGRCHYFDLYAQWKDDW